MKWNGSFEVFQVFRVPPCARMNLYGRWRHMASLPSLGSQFWSDWADDPAPALALSDSLLGFTDSVEDERACLNQRGIPRHNRTQLAKD
jgi:hypothetical protein